MRWLLKFGSYQSRDDIFHMVERGLKTIETRPINKDKKKNYSQIAVGDKLVLVSLDTKRRIEREVTFVHIYDSVAAMAEHEDPGKIYPGIKNAKELISLFDNLKMRWGAEYARKLETFGVVAIGMKEVGQ